MKGLNKKDELWLRSERPQGELKKELTDKKISEKTLIRQLV
jgi:hypothetical protein